MLKMLQVRRRRARLARAATETGMWTKFWDAYAKLANYNN